MSKRMSSCLSISSSSHPHLLPPIYVAPLYGGEIPRFGPALLILSLVQDGGQDHKEENPLAKWQPP